MVGRRNQKNEKRPGCKSAICISDGSNNIHNNTNNGIVGTLEKENKLYGITPEAQPLTYDQYVAFGFSLIPANSTEVVSAIFAAYAASWSYIFYMRILNLKKGVFQTM